LTNLEDFVVSRNRLSGEVPQSVVDGWQSLYRLDVSFNDFRGRIPTFGEQTPRLRFLLLDHNRFSGDFEAQLVGFAENQVSTSGSSVNLGHNDLSGPLPQVFQNILTNAHSISELHAEENHFLCDAGSTDWPAWAFRIGSSPFGMCTMPPMPNAVINARPGDLMSVIGAHFAASDELKCKISMLRQSSLEGGEVEAEIEEEVVVAASFVNESAVLCPFPETMPAGRQYLVAIANYGNDYSGPETLGSGYAPLFTQIPLSPPPPSPPPPPPPSDDSVNVVLVVGVVVAVVVAALAVAGVLYMALRERSGKPLFAPFLDAPNEVARNKSSTAMIPGEIKIDERGTELQDSISVPL